MAAVGPPAPRGDARAGPPRGSVTTRERSPDARGPWPRSDAVRRRRPVRCPRRAARGRSAQRATSGPRRAVSRARTPYDGRLGGPAAPRHGGLVHRRAGGAPDGPGRRDGRRANGAQADRRRAQLGRGTPGGGADRSRGRRPRGRGMIRVVTVRTGAYQDSVTLMQVSREIVERPGVHAALVAMATE